MKSTLKNSYYYTFKHPVLLVAACQPNSKEKFIS
jgi:hypothetical protein